MERACRSRMLLILLLNGSADVEATLRATQLSSGNSLTSAFSFGMLRTSALLTRRTVAPSLAHPAGKTEKKGLSR